MQKFTIEEARKNTERLAGNEYPGRGLVVGRSADGKTALQVLWLMGRNPDSRNRILVHSAIDNISTAPHNPLTLKNPHNIIYRGASRVTIGGGVLKQYLATNGDQTGTLEGYLRNGLSFKAALDTRTYEDDKPNNTPRISSLVQVGRSPVKPYWLSVISKGADSDDPVRRYFSGTIDDFELGTGLTVHTYDGNAPSGQPLPSFSKEPYGVILGEAVDDTAEQWWEQLNPDNRVAIVVRGISTLNNTATYRIINALGDRPVAA